MKDSPILSISMADQGKKSNYKGLKIFCTVFSALLIIFIIVIIVLFLTVFKPKQPKLTTQSVTLDYITWVPLTTHLNITLGVKVSIHNPNYGSFKYGNSTVFVTYRGIVAAEAPVEADTIPARGDHEMSTSLKIVAENLLSNTYFLMDLASGRLNFTSTTTLHGKATMFKILKVKATTYSTCDISVQYKEQNAISSCTSKLKY